VHGTPHAARSPEPKDGLHRRRRRRWDRPRALAPQVHREGTSAWSVGRFLSTVGRHLLHLQIVMVDIDGVVVDFCRQNLPQNAAAFADPRLELIIDDAKGKLESFPPASFDVILMDLDDPLEGGPCYWVQSVSACGRSSTWLVCRMHCPCHCALHTYTSARCVVTKCARHICGPCACIRSTWQCGLTAS
jgi:hypothetical protein